MLLRSEYWLVSNVTRSVVEKIKYQRLGQYPNFSTLSYQPASPSIDPLAFQSHFESQGILSEACYDRYSGSVVPC